MTRFVGLDVSPKVTALCVIDNTGRRLWRGQCPSVPGASKKSHLPMSAPQWRRIAFGSTKCWHTGVAIHDLSGGRDDHSVAYRAGRRLRCGPLLAWCEPSMASVRR
jgi:hypothetical protein